MFLKMLVGNRSSKFTVVTVTFLCKVTLLVRMLDFFIIIHVYLNFCLLCLLFSSVMYYSKCEINVN